MRMSPDSTLRRSLFALAITALVAASGCAVDSAESDAEDGAPEVEETAQSDDALTLTCPRPRLVKALGRAAATRKCQAKGYSSASRITGSTYAYCCS